jgi:hypothetical protein
MKGKKCLVLLLVLLSVFICLSTIVCKAEDKVKVDPKPFIIAKTLALTVPADEDGVCVLDFANKGAGIVYSKDKGDILIGIIQNGIPIYVVYNEKTEQYSAGAITSSGAMLLECSPEQALEFATKVLELIENKS